MEKKYTQKDNQKGIISAEEKFFSSINYQKMLDISEEKANQLAINNFCLRQDMDGSLIKKATNNNKIKFSEYFINSKKKTKEIKESLPNNSGCIFALFHFSEHINVPLDLALAGIPITLPVAGEPFNLLYKNKLNYADAFVNIELLQVENRSTAGKMIKALKNGQNLCIYVDGNMGQDGVNVSTSAIEINFFGFQIRVKNSISKLSAKYKLPVVPIFAETDQKGQAILTTGEILFPENTNMMQCLYNELQQRITQQPEKWFYVQCLHRWVVQEEQKLSEPELNEHSDLDFNHAHARLFNKGHNWFIVNYLTQRAVLIDDSLKDDVLDHASQKIQPDLLKRVNANSSSASRGFISSLIKENLVSLRSQTT